MWPGSRSEPSPARWLAWSDAPSTGARLGESRDRRAVRRARRDFARICQAADELRAAAAGDTVTYVVTRNINYTNICLYHCGFCAFSKGKAHASLRGEPYLVDLGEIRRRVREAWERGATEVCMQGGIHPSFTGETYLSICRAAKEAVPEIHVHAFSPLEVTHGARTLGISIREFLETCKAAGLGSLPGTAAEILDDEIRAHDLPGQARPRRVGWTWSAQAHAVGLRTTSTIMFGHLERYAHWARHLLHLRDLQQDTRRLHRVRATAVRAHGGAALPEGAGAQGADLARGHPDARRRAPGAASALSQHPGVVGQAGPALGAGVPAQRAPTTWAAR